MTGEVRRDRIIEVLVNAQEAVSGTKLAELANVSRQVIVADISLLRTMGFKILSTNRGYIIEKANHISRVFKVLHNDEQIEDELYTIVDAGGRILDVFVYHGIYGELKAELLLSSRRDVDDFIEQMKSGRISPLKHLTNDYHYHTVAGESEELLNFIEERLSNKGYLQK